MNSSRCAKPMASESYSLQWQWVCWREGIPTPIICRGLKSGSAGGFYADRVTQRGIDVGIEFSRLAKGGRAKRGSTGCRLVEGTAGNYRAADRSAHSPQLESFLEIMESRLDMAYKRPVTNSCPYGSAVANFHNTADWMKAKIV